MVKSMERKIILATHGHFSEAIKESCELIMGKQEKISTLSVITGMGADEMYEFFCNEIEDSLQKDGCLPLIMVDIMGGSPYNQAIRTLRDYEVSIVTGLNLPMLVEVIVMRNQLGYEELAELASEVGRNGVGIATRESLLKANV